jgi:2-methylfumaryl-CoA isomerase
VMVVGLTRRQWKGLRSATGLAPAFDAVGQSLGLDLEEEGNRFRAREPLNAVLAQWIATRDFAEVGRVFNAHDVCFGPYQTVMELLRDDPEASVDNPLFKRVNQPGIGAYRMPGSPLYFSNAIHEDPRPAPRLGEHTDEILATMLGLGDGEIGRLHDQGIVAGVE